MAPKDDGCISLGKRQWSARLADNGGKDWETAAATTSIAINGIDVGKPHKTVNHHLGGMWGEWYLKDDTCKPYWDTPKKDFCTADGERQYSTLFVTNNVPLDNPEEVAKNTSISFDLGTYSPRTEWNTGQLWGTFKVKDATCSVNWGYVDELLKNQGPDLAWKKASELNKEKGGATDGCSTPLNDPVSISYKDQFFQACVIHDLCYALPWSIDTKGRDGKAFCDALFYGEMKKVCDDPICETAAATWLTSVDKFARPAYDNAQAKSFAKLGDTGDLSNLFGGGCPIDSVGAIVPYPGRNWYILFEKNSPRYTYYKVDEKSWERVFNLKEFGGGGCPFKEIGGAFIFKSGGKDKIMLFDAESAQYLSYMDGVWSQQYNFKTDFAGGGAPFANVGAIVPYPGRPWFIIFDRDKGQYTYYKQDAKAWTQIFAMSEFYGGKCPFSSIGAATIYNYVPGKQILLLFDASGKKFTFLEV